MTEVQGVTDRPPVWVITTPGGLHAVMKIDKRFHVWKNGNLTHVVVDGWDEVIEEVKI